MTQLRLFDDPMPLLDQADPDGEYGGRSDLPHDEPGNVAAVEAFEDYLRQKGSPYVAVDEARRAIFAKPDIDHFDFLVYSETGPNLLVLLVGQEGPAEADVSLLEDWEKVFGPNFHGCLVTFSRKKWRAMTIREWRNIGWHPTDFDLRL